MNLTKLTAALTWKTAKGRELVRLEEGADAAEVLIGRTSEADLRALAQAAIEAADHIRDYQGVEAEQQAQAA